MQCVISLDDVPKEISDKLDKQPDRRDEIVKARAWGAGPWRFFKGRDGQNGLEPLN